MIIPGCRAVQQIAQPQQPEGDHLSKTTQLNNEHISLFGVKNIKKQQSQHVSRSIAADQKRGQQCWARSKCCAKACCSHQVWSIKGEPSFSQTSGWETPVEPTKQDLTILFHDVYLTMYTWWDWFPSALHYTASQSFFQRQASVCRNSRLQADRFRKKMAVFSVWASSEISICTCVSGRCCEGADLLSEEGQR